MNLPHASSTYEPQGFCPKAWIARIDGEALRTSSGGVKRFGSKVAALKAAEKIIKENAK